MTSTHFAARPRTGMPAGEFRTSCFLCQTKRAGLRGVSLCKDRGISEVRVRDKYSEVGLIQRQRIVWCVGWRYDGLEEKCGASGTLEGDVYAKFD